MRILTASWRDGYLDYAREPGHCRVRVAIWRELGAIEGMYFVRRTDVAALVNYWREIGWRELARKVRSRWLERSRNRKCLAYGLGDVVESDPTSPLGPGTRVIFVAPCHPPCVERLALPEALLRPVTSCVLADYEPGATVWCVEARPDGARPSVASVAGGLHGWSSWSGESLSERTLEALLAAAEAELGALIAGGRMAGRRLPAGRGRAVSERARARRPPTPGRLTAVLFGYGNYAKTAILPNLGPGIELAKIHEVDPLQLGLAKHHRIALDSSPWPRPDERFDVYLVAGFHHTHADIAVTALGQGAAVVLEKPLATEWEQVDALEGALRSGRGRLFAGFQRRYWPFTALARADLGITPGEPVCYRCVVDEEPLPPRHWYRWLRSRGRIVANGCHWIDHFLFLNGHAAVRRVEAATVECGDIVAGLELDNGARFEMRLTDRATSRTGMRNTIELRARGVTVRVDNDRDYRAETTTRLLRRARQPRLDAYRAMYRGIAERISRGGPGDALDSITRSARVTLMLADQVEVSARSGAAR
jgi:predicted dehydrogenase